MSASPTAPVMISSISRCVSGLSVTCTAATLSSISAGRRVPHKATSTCLCASTQAIASWGKVGPETLSHPL